MLMLLIYTTIYLTILYIYNFSSNYDIQKAENIFRLKMYTCLNMILLIGKVMPTLIIAAPQPQTNSEYSSRLKCIKKAISCYC